MSNTAIKENLEYPMNISGVEIKPLKTHKDERGFFREVVRFNDAFFNDTKNFGQWSVYFQVIRESRSASFRRPRVGCGSRSIHLRGITVLSKYATIEIYPTNGDTTLRLMTDMIYARHVAQQPLTGQPPTLGLHVSPPPRLGEMHQQTSHQR